jgi:hypothetical protein
MNVFPHEKTWFFEPEQGYSAVPMTAMRQIPIRINEDAL